MGRRILWLVAVIALVVAACSSGGSLSAQDQAHADAITRSMMEDADPDSPFGDEEAACYGNAIVSELGSERLTELGLSVEAIESGTDPDDVELEDTDIDAMVGAMTECIDIAALFMEDFAASGVSAESISCMADGMDDDVSDAIARSIFTSQDLAEDGEASAGIFQLILDCFSEEDLAKIGGG